ncbi:hypothetical protein BZA05DRAFT_410209 [Tricharina praecox]|uniref:uncharacterized protein n=1 Tax=Tricharina praecox TaxID=43433 RepID=UPI00221F3D41|nr:uncharacterized protein BZA05DRAFT_410209 [Tricharina praecox]KAI5844197.1 hypothetical protein BZA05DRAFT_410209 [Tricharina praecox]
MRCAGPLYPPYVPALPACSTCLLHHVLVILLCLRIVPSLSPSLSFSVPPQVCLSLPLCVRHYHYHYHRELRYSTNPLRCRVPADGLCTSTSNLHSFLPSFLRRA